MSTLYRLLAVTLVGIFILFLGFTVILYLKGYWIVSIFSPVQSNRKGKIVLDIPKPFFYGMNVEMSQILPSSQKYVVNDRGEDLIDIAARLGINMFRITNQTRSFENNQDAIYTKNQWDQVLDKMQRRGIAAVILLEAAVNNGDLYTPDIRPAYLDLVKRYLVDSGVLDHPDVYGVDIKNEPSLTVNNIEMLRKAKDIIKEKYPNIKISIGWWRVETGKKDSDGNEIYRWDDYAAGKKIDSIVDYYSIHMYGFDDRFFGLYPDPVLKTKIFLRELKAGLQTSKPILIEEFGSANGDAVSDQDTIGSPELQANTYRGVLQALNDIQDSQIIGVVGYQLYPRGEYPDAWVIIKDRGNYLFPAARVIQNFALGTSLSGVDFQNKNNSQLLTNSSNGKTMKAKIGDRVGLKLAFNPAYDYELVFSDSDAKYLSEELRYDDDHQYYFALFQLKQSGSLKASINSLKKCENKNNCDFKSTEVFRVRFQVE
jgi:hypothetical protein